MTNDISKRSPPPSERRFFDSSTKSWLAPTEGSFNTVRSHKRKSDDRRSTMQALRSLRTQKLIPVLLATRMETSNDAALPGSNSSDKPDIHMVDSATLSITSFHSRRAVKTPPVTCSGKRRLKRKQRIV